MAFFIKKFSIRTLGQPISNQVLLIMPEEKKTQLLEKQVKELTRQLEHEKLRHEALQKLIRVAEDELHIRIKKRVVPNSQKNEAKSSKDKLLRLCARFGISRQLTMKRRSMRTIPS